VNEENIIRGCIAYDSAAQKALYKVHAPKMYAICLRYVRDADDAKDIMQESFIKVFGNIQKFRSEGSLEGWIKRIVVNTTLSHLQKNKALSHHLDASEIDLSDTDAYSNDGELNGKGFSEEELLLEIEKLPDNYKIIFNLFCLDNYSHKMIAEQLSITEESSRIRLNRARKILQDRLRNLSKEHIKSVYHA
jgi:RNA polymerase sigma-70 factor, ECF subfamily